MSGFLTLVQNPTDTHLSQRSTAVRNSWKGMPTKSVFGKLKEQPLFSWYSLRLEAPPEFVCFTVLPALFQILSGPLLVLFSSPVSRNLPVLFHCIVLWSSLSIASCLSLYFFAIVWCVSVLNFMCCGLLHILFVKLYVSLSFSFVWCVSLLYLFSALVFCHLCIVNKVPSMPYNKLRFFHTVECCRGCRFSVMPSARHSGPGVGWAKSATSWLTCKDFSIRWIWQRWRKRTCAGN